MKLLNIVRKCSYEKILKTILTIQIQTERKKNTCILKLQLKQTPRRENAKEKCDDQLADVSK